jgi:hypothetical protein
MCGWLRLLHRFRGRQFWYPVNRTGKLVCDYGAKVLMSESPWTEAPPSTRSYFALKKAIQDSHLDLSEIKEVEILDSEFEKWQLLAGDLLLTEGGDWDKLGRGTVWNNEIPNCIHQNHVFRLRTVQNLCDPYFLSALIGSPCGKEYFKNASKQTTNTSLLGF